MFWLDISIITLFYKTQDGHDIAVFFMICRFFAPVFAMLLFLSSWNVKSICQCRLFSTPQCPRAALLNSSASASIRFFQRFMHHSKTPQVFPFFLSTVPAGILCYIILPCNTAPMFRLNGFLITVFLFLYSFQAFPVKIALCSTKPGKSCTRTFG